MTAATLLRVTSASFSRVLEACDRRSQLACYADQAEVSIVSNRRGPRQHLRGKPAIGDWIDRSCADKRVMRVVHSGQNGDEMTVIAEFQCHDGTFGVYSCIAQLRGGLIVKQQVVLL